MSSKARSDSVDLDTKSVSLPAEPPSPLLVDPPSRKGTTWLGALWDTFDLPRDERRLLVKIDASLLIFASLGYFIKNLDQTNINSAFLSGMKEDLGMYGNELVTAQSIWTVGYVLGQIPSNLVLTRVSPHIVIPALEFGWGIATLATYCVQDVKALYALRFLVGLFESGFYPGMHYILGSWYKPSELAKRSAIFWTAGSLGSMFSGFLQTAAHEGLNGRHGLAGWRYLFIIDAIITIPIALLGFVFLPGLPWNAKPSFWLSGAEIDLAQSRMKSIGREEAKPWTRGKVKTLFSRWYIYVLPFLYVIWNNSSMQQPMGFWLKSFNAQPAPVPGVSYTVAQINLLPLPSTAIFVVAALSWAWISDGPLKGRRWPFIYLGAGIDIVIAAVLRSLPVYSHFSAHYALYYLLQIGHGAGPLILNWISEISGGDNEQRAILVALANDLAYVVQAVAPNFVWRTTDFPRASKGLLWSITLNALLIFWTTLVLLLLRRDYLSGIRLPSEALAESKAASIEAAAMQEQAADGGQNDEVDRLAKEKELRKMTSEFM